MARFRANQTLPVTGIVAGFQVKQRRQLLCSGDIYYLNLASNAEVGWQLCVWNISEHKQTSDELKREIVYVFHGECS